MTYKDLIMGLQRIMRNFWRIKIVKKGFMNRLIVEQVGPTNKLRLIMVMQITLNIIHIQINNNDMLTTINPITIMVKINKHARHPQLTLTLI